MSGLQDLDLIVSFLACGYVFPVGRYRELLHSGLRPGGDILIDIRDGWIRETEADLTTMGNVVRLGSAADGKAQRIRLHRPSKSRHAAA